MIPNRKEIVVANKPGPCTDCPDLNHCTIMCEQVDLWVNQDTKGRSSTMHLENRTRYGFEDRLDDYVDYAAFLNPDVMLPDSDTSREAWMEIRSMRLSDKVIRFIYSYYMLGNRIRDIAIDEKTSSQAIDQRHIQAKISVAQRIEQREFWKYIKSSIKYISVRDYDICYLFFGAGYPKRVIAKIVGLHVSTIIKIISNKNSELDDLS